MSSASFLKKCGFVIKKAFFLTPTITITGIATAVPLTYLLVTDRKPIDIRDELHKVDYKKAYIREASIEVSELFQRDVESLSDAQIEMKSKLQPVYDLQLQLNKMDQSSPDFANVKQSHDDELLKIIRETKQQRYANVGTTVHDATFEDRVFMLARHLTAEKEKSLLRYNAETK